MTTFLLGVVRKAQIYCHMSKRQDEDLGYLYHFRPVFTDQRYIQFIIFKPLSYCLEEAIGFDVKASFASRPVSRLIRWYKYNKLGDVTKEFWEKAIQFHGAFHGLEITNCVIVF